MILPSIADHELICRISGGSYGEVWLARNALGAGRAVKIVHRTSFDHDRPFEREFAGIQKFEPVSRSHEGLIDLLQVGRNPAAGYFYYMMELADDLNGESGARNGAGWMESSYVPRTLASEIRKHGRLPLDQCITIGLALAAALAALHAQGLVHRDIKPSNIIFVGGVPKLADVGLVISLGEARSYVGTEGFIAPEGPGTPQADLYSLGIVLYQMSTGKSHQDFPEPLSSLAAEPDRSRWLEFNAVVHRAACADLRGRYRSAAEMVSDQALLTKGGSVRRAAQIVRRRQLARWCLGSIAGVITLAALIFLLAHALQPTVDPEATKGSTNQVAQTLFDQGRHYYIKKSDEESGTKYFREAVKVDPNFALAQSYLAASLSWGHYYPLYYEQFPHLDEAAKVAQHALELDKNLSKAHLALGSYDAVRRHDLTEAAKHFKKAIRCDPSNSEPHEWYGNVLGWFGQTNQAIRELRKAERLSGFEPAVNTFLGDALFNARQYNQAAEKFQKALNMPAVDADAGWWSRWELARAVLWRDIKTDRAIEAWLDAAYDPKEPWVSALKQVLHQHGQAAFWEKRLEEVSKQTTDPLIRAEACAMAGHTSEALDYLKEAFQQHHDFLLLTLRTAPEFDSLRDQHRFQELIKVVYAPK
jgi:serine/threonine protein kinase